MSTATTCATDCNRSETLDYSPVILTMVGMKVGCSYSDYIDFFQLVSGKWLPEDITGDTFNMEIRDSSGTLISTLVLTGGLLVGGLEKEGTARLKYRISAPVTDTAGKYTIVLNLVNASNGDNFPLAVGSTSVKP